MGIAKEHLSQDQRISAARDLFTVKSSTADELHGLCPFHDEENPSFSYNFEKDAYHCLSCNVAGDLVALWGRRHGVHDQKEGFKSFCRAFDIKLKNDHNSTPKKKASEKSRPVTQAELDEAWQTIPPLPDAWKKRLSEVRGWSIEAMDRLDLRLQTVFRNKKSGRLITLKRPERVAIPIFDRKGVLKNIRVYKPGATEMKIVSWGAGCGTARLFPPAPLEDDVPVLLCEGEQDTICAISNGFNAITQTSKTKAWNKEHLKPFTGRDVIIAYDADAAGEKYGRFAADNLSDVAKSVRILEWPDYMGRQSDGSWPEKHGQDLTDFFVKHHKTPADLREFIATARPYEKEKTPDAPAAVMQFFEFGVNGRKVFKPRLLVDRILKDLSLMFDPGTKLLYLWNHQFWEIYREEYIENLCLRYLGEEASKSRAKDVTFQAVRLSNIPHGRTVNDRTDWICVKNGMINLKTLELSPHEKAFYSTIQHDVTFNPTSQKSCRNWMAFLEKSVQTPEAIMQLQEFAGYCLTRDTRYEKCLFLLGDGSDGKSTYLKTLRKLCGPANCSAVSFQDLEDQFLRASVYGKLLNISTEVGSKALESQYFKAIVTGDPIQGAFKHQDSFEFLPFCKLAFAGNKLPRVLDNTDGFFRRLLPVRFKRQFLPGDPERDGFLDVKLDEELSEIFQWALVGLHRLWEQGGFTTSPETDGLMQVYRRLNNPVVCFVEDKCVIGSEDTYVEKDELYKSYRTYCTTFGYSAHHKENFLRELYAAQAHLKTYRPKVNGSRRYCVKGIKLAETIE